MTKTEKIVAGIIIAILALISIKSFLSEPKEQAPIVIGSSPDGVASVEATSTTVLVGPGGARTLYPATSPCTARSISTQGQAILISFDPNYAASSTYGHIQAASTSVSYGSGVFGCGPMTAYGFSASTTLTLTEFR